MRLSIVVVVAATSFAFGAAFAKLPAPSDEAKAKAAETANKAAWNDKVAAYQLCKAQDRVADTYRKDAKGSGKTAPAPTTRIDVMRGVYPPDLYTRAASRVVNR